MPTEARIHHYIPQAYLRGFGWNKGKNWYVHALDLKNQSVFQPNTKNICCERDFMRVDVEGHPPDVIEKEIGKLEHQARQAILHVSQSHTFEGADRNVILNLMALLATRSPRQRENWRQFHEQIAKQVMSLSLATKERWESQMRQMKEAGKPVNDAVTFEQMKDFHERGEYKVSVAREFQIGMEMKGIDTMLDLLDARKWRLYYAGQDEGTFVTTDRPVSLTWLRPGEVPPFYRRSPGFGMTHTEIIFPLTKACLLHGRFEGIEEGSEEAYAGFIGACNTRMITTAFDYAFGAEKAFPYYLPPGEIFWDDRFMKRAAEVQKNQPPAAQDEEWNVEDGPPHSEEFHPDRAAGNA